MYNSDVESFKIHFTDINFKIRRNDRSDIICKPQSPHLGQQHVLIDFEDLNISP